MKKLTLKNYLFLGNAQFKVESLQEWLFNLKLHGKQSRARNRFLALITPRTTEIDKERLKLAEEHAAKDKDGKIIYLENIKDKDGNPTDKTQETTDKGKGTAYKLQDVDAFNKVYNEYLNEDFIINVSPETRDTIYGVRDIILNTEEEFSGMAATRYNEWCTAFEEISEEKENKKAK
jgi:hypothetical protein